MKPIKINGKDVPKVIRKKARRIVELHERKDILGLRALRDSSTNFEINIYHHSQGTDSYYHDTERQYYRWTEIEQLTESKLKEPNKYFAVVVLEYKPGVLFVKRSIDYKLN